MNQVKGLEKAQQSHEFSGETSTHRSDDRLPSILQRHPLQDEKSEIRLLTIIPGAVNDPLVCYIGVYKLSTAPPYIALSYAWGDVSEMRTIILDEQAISVRKNCWYALWQMRSAFSYLWIWIDAICIDQANLSEKSEQVRLMATIYAKATSVAASLGPHENDSFFLLMFMCVTASLVWSRRPKKRYEIFQLSERMLRNQKKATSDRIRLALADFSERPYWSRFWILQELSAAKRVCFLCGDLRLDESVLLCFIALLWEYHSCSSALNAGDIAKTMSIDLAYRIYESPFFQVQIIILRRLQPFPAPLRTGADADGLPTLAGLLETFSSWQCTDARDRLYGLMSMIQWTGARPTTAPLPDYTRSVFGLAVQVLKEDNDHLGKYEVHRYHYATKLLRGLRLDMADADIVPSLSSRREKVERSPRKKCRPQVHPSHIKVKGHLTETWCVIDVDCEGALTAAFNSSDGLDLSVLYRSDAEFYALHRSFGIWSHPLMHNGNVAGLVCGETKPGDILMEIDHIMLTVPLSHRFFRAPHVVLRWCVDGLFEIIGQAVVVDGFHICCAANKCLGGSDEHGWEHRLPDGMLAHQKMDLTFELFFDAEDLLILLCQNEGYPQGFPHEVFAQMETRVCRSRFSSFASAQRKKRNPFLDDFGHRIISKDVVDVEQDSDSPPDSEVDENDKKSQYNVQ